jgi:YegS/Rv2252/BmrU family lipid kinase
MSRAKGPYVFILNPQAAAGTTRRRFERVRSRFESALPSVQVKLTEAPGHATELCREAIADGAGAVVAVGGDGTINEVVGGFFDEQGERLEGDAVLGVVTSGTGGDFRKTFGWGTEPLDDLKRLERNKRRPLDVGRLRYTTSSGGEGVRMFINIASFGMSGAVVENANASSKRLGGKSTFMAATVKQIIAYRAKPVRMILDDGEPTETRITTVAVANGQYFGGGMWFAPEASPDDGLFDVVTIGEASPAFWLRKGLRLYNGTHLELSQVSHTRCRKVRAEPLVDEPVLIETDGEQPGRLPATFELLPGAIDVLD